MSESFNLAQHKSAQTIRIQLHNGDIADLDNNFLSLLDPENPIEALHDFIDNLQDDECCIIKNHAKDMHVLKSLKERTDLDVEETAKALCMEG